MFPSPIIVAPMAGGTTTVDLVVAAGRAGGFGFLAAGYKSAETLAGQVAQARAAGVDFGVNVFVPGAIPPDAAALAVYRQELEAEAAAYGWIFRPFLRTTTAGRRRSTCWLPIRCRM